MAASESPAAGGFLRYAFGGVLSFSIVVLIGVLAFSIRLFSVIKYESVIHEFDPYFNSRVTQFLTKNGIYDFWNWFDDPTWWNCISWLGPDCRHQVVSYRRLYTWVCFVVFLKTCQIKP